MGSEYTGTATKSRSSVSYCTMILRMHVALALHVHTLNPTPYTLHPTTPTHYTIHPKPVLLTSASASLFCHQHPPARPSPPSSSCRLSATLVPPGPRLSLELQARGRCGERDCAARGRCVILCQQDDLACQQGDAFRALEADILPTNPPFEREFRLL